MNRERLQELIAKFPTQRIGVIGDFFLDKYLEVDPALAEISVETGKQANQVVAVRCSPGAAGTVVNNLSALGAGSLAAIGAIGDDGEGYDLRAQLARRNCRTDGLLCTERLMTPTYLKPRDMAVPGLEGEHERYDTRNRRPTPAEVIAGVIAALDAHLPELDALIIADQVVEDGWGIITTEVRNALSERAAQSPNVIFWADSRRRIDQFRGVITKPNQFEAVGRVDPQPGEEIGLGALQVAARRLRERTSAPVCITRGPHGALVTDPELIAISGVRLHGPLDTTGAGDSVTAGAVLALAAGATFPEAVLVGMLTASITVQQLATTGTATPAQLLERLEVWRAQALPD